MSENAIYATYPKMSDPIRYMLGFFRENRSLLPEGTFERLERLSGYDIGREAKMTEFFQIVAKLSLGKDADEQLRFRNEMQNRMTTYAKEHLRELESTGIAKLSLPDLSVAANGSVPGFPLNQFSLDEYDGNLRVATTVGGRSASVFGWGGGRGTSANDVYILDADLDVEGELLDLGLGERIYAARFIGETGYLVTFRETDPFYVLDLSDPDDPRKAGELKIPGYSSYLHPLGKDMILGIGKEEDKVKLSLFDVSSPDEPREISKYSLDEYWSEAVQNHHAFLVDPEHRLFFLPGGQGGYVFSYKGNELSLAKAAKDDRVRRAVFIGDTFYIVSEDAVYAFDENTWEKVGELEL
jgi:inhibitor of cysteine peptidase